MNETRDIPKLLERWGHLPLAELPADVREQVLASEAARVAFARNDQLAALLRLKRHELPDAAYEGRLLHRVRTRLDNQAGLEPADPVELGLAPARPWRWLAPLGLAAALAVTFTVVTPSRSPSPAGAPTVAVSETPVNPPAMVADTTPNPPVAGLTDAQVRSIFAVEKTTNNLDRFIRENHLEVVDLSTNGTHQGQNPFTPNLVPVRNDPAPVKPGP
jgi:hypothetical protein